MVDPETPPEATVVWDAPGAFIVRLRWRPVREAAEQERFQVLKVREGKIKEMADFLALGAATRAAKRFAAD
jgi:hypothetical protein